MKIYKISDKNLDEFIELSEKEGHKYKNREEARSAAQHLVGFVDTLVEMDIDRRRRDEKLKDNPNGYAFPGDGRSCSLCSRSIHGDMWWDKWGQKCMDCQEAFRKKIIPGYCFKDHKNEKHITISKLSWKFDMHIQTLKKLSRQGKIKVRTVKGNGTLVVLRKENPNLIDIIESEKKELEKRRSGSS